MSNVISIYFYSMDHFATQSSGLRVTSLSNFSQMTDFYGSVNNSKQHPSQLQSIPSTSSLDKGNDPSCFVVKTILLK